ncbi:MAG TPA: hypothetical protein ENH94_00340 [Phycisphaerales bacterium]|nr:hypothetical protein [Phycisphaerales bacterium]
MSEIGFVLLRLRTTLEACLAELDTVEIYGSGQTTDEEPVGDITFEYIGRKYKLVLEDQGLVQPKKEE